MSDDLTVVLLGAASAAAVGLVGLLLLRLLRKRPAYASLATVAITGVLAVLAGMLVAARAMFISPHDLRVVLLVSAPAGLVALAVALLLGRRVVMASDTLRAAMQALAAGEVPSFAAAPSTAELSELSRELQATSARLADSRAREQALEASRRELISWVSHDLRSPLAGLRAMAEALEDGVAEDVPRYHRQIRLEADRLAGLVDDLFQLSRLHSGTLQLALDRVALDDLVSDTLAAAAPLAQAAGVRLTGRAEAVLPVRADSRELSRALNNLVVNAIRHTPAGGTVEVVADSAGEGLARLSVRDACGGIPPADLPRVFDVAWRGDDARARGAGERGGLGLAIVAGIVAAHRGTVSVANVNGGCRFEVCLPQLHDLTVREQVP